MSRWKAAGIHLALSVLVAAALTAIMYALWYPPPYFVMMGGSVLLLLIVGCDVAIGPLITLIIFRQGKKSLTLDLATIAFLQAVALAYGLYTMFEARPVFTVFAVDRFEVVSANEIKPEDLAEGSAPEFKTLSLTGPRIVAAVPPANPQERSDLLFALNRAGKDIQNVPRLYVPYDSVAANAAKRARPLALLEEKNPASRDQIEAAIKAMAVPRDNLAFLPIEGRAVDMAMVVDNTSGRPLGTVEAIPW